MFIAEVPADKQPGMQIVFKVPDADACTDAFGAESDSAVEVVTPFQDTHWGTREMTVREPDGRVWPLSGTWASPLRGTSASDTPTQAAAKVSVPAGSRASARPADRGGSR